MKVLLTTRGEFVLPSGKVPASQVTFFDEKGGGAHTRMSRGTEIENTFGGGVDGKVQKKKKSLYLLFTEPAY